MSRKITRTETKKQDRSRFVPDIELFTMGRNALVAHCNRQPCTMRSKRKDDLGIGVVVTPRWCRYNEWKFIDPNGTKGIRMAITLPASLLISKTNIITSTNTLDFATTSRRARTGTTWKRIDDVIELASLPSCMRLFYLMTNALLSHIKTVSRLFSLFLICCWKWIFYLDTVHLAGAIWCSHDHPVQWHQSQHRPATLSQPLSMIDLAGRDYAHVQEEDLHVYLLLDGGVRKAEATESKSTEKLFLMVVVSFAWELL